MSTGWLGHTPLHLAAMTGNCAAVRALVRAGADVDAVNSLGETSLHLAASANFAHIVTELLAMNANASVRNAQGRLYHEGLLTQVRMWVGYFDKMDKGSVFLTM